MYRIEFYGRQEIEKAVYDALIHYVDNVDELSEAQKQVHDIVENTIAEYALRLLMKDY